MPYTLVVVWTKSGALAADVAAACAGRPTRVVDVRDGEACLQALADARFPVLVLDADALDSDAPECLTRALETEAISACIGAPDRDLHERTWEFGATTWLPRRAAAEQWAVWMARFLAESQRRFAATAPAADP